MPRSLPPIPSQSPITDRLGIITDFFRYRWQNLIDGFIQSPTLALVRKIAQPGALATTILWTTTTAGVYRVTVYARVTQAATTSSSLTITIGWVESGVALTKTFAAITGNTVTTIDSQTIEIEVDKATNLTIAAAYASVGGVPMIWRATATVEWQV